jgi:hypothetical protein
MFVLKTIATIDRCTAEEALFPRLGVVCFLVGGR